MPEISDDNEDFSIQKIPVEDLYEKALSIYMNSRDLLIEISQFLDSEN
jgi:CMP-N-acetylneuraminic acid synthetase